MQEDYVNDAFLKVLGLLADDIEKIKNNIINKVSILLNQTSAEEPDELQYEIEQLQMHMMEIYKKKTRGEISVEDYTIKATDVATKINSLRLEQEKQESIKGTALLSKKRLEEIEKYLDTINPTTEFNDEMFTSLIDQVVVRNRYELEFQFKIGINKTYKPE